MSRIAFFWFLASAACLASPPASRPERVSAGRWGGTGIALEVTDAGGTLDYDCAHGTVSEPILLDGQGHFDVKGAHYREHGGPVREDETAKGLPVRYTGQVRDDEMTLTVRPEGRDDVIGSYTLVRGKAGRVRKCL
jgi:hypothetical protein